MAGGVLDSRRSWLVLASSWLVMAVVHGQLVSIGVYVSVLVDTHGWSREHAAYLGAFLFLAFGIASPIATAAFYSLGSRKTVMIGATIAASGYTIAFFVRSVGQLVGAYFVIGLRPPTDSRGDRRHAGFGFALLLVTAFGVIPEYFEKYRSTALALVTVGGGLGIFAMPTIVYQLIEWFGWQGSMLINAGICMQLFVCAMVMRSTGAFKAKKFSLSHLCHTAMLRDRYFVLVALMLLTYGGAFTVHDAMINTLMVERGLSIGAAAALVSLSGAFNIGGRLLAVAFVQLSERHLLLFSAAITLITAASLACAFCRSSAAFAVFVALYGLGYGCYRATSPSVFVDLFGAERLAAVRGLLVPFCGITGLTAPIGAGALADAHGIASAFYLAAVFGLLTVIATYAVTIRWQLECRRRHRDQDIPLSG